MCDDERIEDYDDEERVESCITCGDEACFCPNYYCKTCNEPFEGREIIEQVNGKTNIYVHCPCGSSDVIRIDDMFDAAEYSQGDR